MPKTDLSLHAYVYCRAIGADPISLFGRVVRIDHAERGTVYATVSGVFIDPNPPQMRLTIHGEAPPLGALAALAVSGSDATSSMDWEVNECQR